MNIKLKDQGGFTLIELMLVVTIIGIMSTIAIPNLMGYLAKTRQAEAMTNLEGVFTSEQSFLSETDAYSASFTDIGYQGWRQARSFTTIRLPHPPDWAATSWVGKSGTPGAGPPEGTIINVNTPPGASSSTFTCIAAGNVDNDPTYDIWSINQDGVLNNDYNDVIQ